MITAALPGFLAAGALLATVPLVLHLLARRPPDRQPLPTARFLRTEQRTLLRLSRRPSDVPQLLVRMLFAFTLGAGFAGLTWAPERSGVARVVLVDVEAAADIGMDSLLSTVRRTVENGGQNGIDTRVVGYAADQRGSVVVAAALEELASAVGGRRATAADGLRVLRSAMGAEAAVDSAEVVWIMRPTWHQWTDGVGLVREALWPGAIGIRTTAEQPDGARVEEPDEATAEEPDGARAEQEPAASAVRASVDGLPSEAALIRALRALGAEVTGRGSGAELTAPGTDAEARSTWFFAESPSTEHYRALIESAQGGATVVLSGVLQPLGESDEAPWVRDGPEALRSTTSASPRVRTGALLFAGRGPVPVDARTPEGRPAAGARVIAVFDDATPAAAARVVGDGCVVYIAASLADETLTGTPGFVEVVDDLVHGCPAASRTTPLDRGAVTALTRPDLPPRVALGGLDGPSGTPLTSMVLLFALALLGIEALLTRGGRA